MASGRHARIKCLKSRWAACARLVRPSMANATAVVSTDPRRGPASAANSSRSADCAPPYFARSRAIPRPASSPACRERQPPRRRSLMIQRVARLWERWRGPSRSEPCPGMRTTARAASCTASPPVRAPRRRGAPSATLQLLAHARKMIRTVAGGAAGWRARRPTQPLLAHNRMAADSPARSHRRGRFGSRPAPRSWPRIVRPSSPW